MSRDHKKRKAIKDKLAVHFLTIIAHKIMYLIAFSVPND